MYGFNWSKNLITNGLLMAVGILLLNSADTARVKAELPLIDSVDSEVWFNPSNNIDTLVKEALRDKGIEPANRCSDEVFIRRVYLDVIGTLPENAVVRFFLIDRRLDKRARLIDELLEREEFADYWSLKWGDLLRVKSEFPINLWPNAVQAYHRWIHDSVKNNMPYDQFARELLTSSGSNFRVPQVNFYRAIQGQKASAIAGAVSLTFMGVRYETWSAKEQKGLEAFFSKVAYKPTAEWKEEIVMLNPAQMGSLRTMFPDDTAVQIASGEDPRKVFSDWLIDSKNPWFNRNIVNRIWSWLLGRGIIHEVDDIRPDNPAVYPELLTYLEKELVKSNYDLRHIYFLILNSDVYQQSCKPRKQHLDAEKLFACYPVRRLDAEVLIDALCWITQTQESYSSVIPEPFTFIPEEKRTIELSDGSITSEFLEMFGRPTRDTGLESERSNKSSNAQRLHLLNSTHIQKKIERSPRLRRMINTSRRNPDVLIRSIYLTVLSRYPTPSEIALTKNYSQSENLNLGQTVTDLVWALINSKEFLYRH
ncbi:MAG: DUF1553 domain-containing protein [Planctomycetes bacterium]|nr:DUF1553 domain-containing protein [Planctomycetota bacterium]